MAAYAALTSLIQILDQLERHPFPPISLDRRQVESLTEIVTFLQDFLEGHNSSFVHSDKADPLEMRIADAAYAAEDVIESYIVDVIQLPQSASAHILTRIWSSFFNWFRAYNKETATRDLQKVIQKMDSIKKTVMEMMREKSSTEVQAHQPQRNIFRSSSANVKTSSVKCRSTSAHHLTWSWSSTFNCNRGYNKEASIKEIERKVLIEKIREYPSLIRASILFGPKFFTEKNTSVMVGFDDVLLQLLDKLTGGPSSLQVIPITGMGGIGKTTLARNIFQHGYVKEYFDICVWVTISQRYNTEQILSQILYQASGKSSQETEEGLGYELHKYLFGRRYLIIMDDIWSIEVWEEMRFLFADCNNGSRVVVTTRQSFLTSQLSDSNNNLYMEFLDEVNSWNLFLKTVFGKKDFPLELEIIGKKIVKNCRGLPLSIVVIGGLLAKSQHTQAYWEHIEQNLNSIVNSENDENCLKILKLSYQHLPVYLKPCFLYMGIFEEDARIRVSTLIKMWVSEGFLKPENGKSLEKVGEGFLKDLIDRNLILVEGLGYTGNIKYCKIHDLLRNLCLKEAEKEGFYYVIGNHSPEGIHKNSRRRLVYLGMTSKKRVLDALKFAACHVRSFTFETQYDSVGLCPNFRLLRILNAHERYSQGNHLQDVIHELVNSRYVAISISHWFHLPSSINFLWNLHTLRISFGPRGDELIVAPAEIWKMSQLRHVDIVRGLMYLRENPPSGSSNVILENLQTLKGIVNFNCGKEVVKRILNIKRLLIDYREDTRLGPCKDYCLSNLECLHKLESLTIRVYHFLHNITFPQSLKKLSLEYHDDSVVWESMLEKIGNSSPLLEKLKLRWGKFITGKWETVEGQFPNLKFLELSGCRGLKQWMIEDSSHFPFLEHLSLSGLGELEEIPLEIGEIPTLQSIQLWYCNESVVKSVKKVAEVQEELLVRVREHRDMQEALQSLASPNFQFELRRSTSTHHRSWSCCFNWFRGYNKKAASHNDGGEETRRWNNFCQDLQEVMEDMDLIKKEVLQMMRENIVEKCRGLPL